MHSMRGTTGAYPRGGWRVDLSTGLQCLAAVRLSWSLGLRESEKTLLLARWQFAWGVRGGCDVTGPQDLGNHQEVQETKEGSPGVKSKHRNGG